MEDYHFKTKGTILREATFYDLAMFDNPLMFRGYALAIESVLRTPIAIFEDSEGSLVGLTRNQVASLAKENSSSETHSQSQPKCIDELTRVVKFASFAQPSLRSDLVFWQLQ